MPDFVFACKASEIPEGGKKLLEVADQLVVIFQVEGEFFALDDICTHDDGPLSEGALEDHTIACPRHGAKFDIRDGRALTMPATKPTGSYEVKVEGEDLYVNFGD